MKCSPRVLYADPFDRAFKVPCSIEQDVVDDTAHHHTKNLHTLLSEFLNLRKSHKTIGLERTNKIEQERKM